MISTAPLNPRFTFKTHLLTPRRFDPPTFRSRSLQFSQLSSTKLPLGFHRIVEVKAIWGWFNRQRDQNDKDIVIARKKTPEFLRFLENDEDGGELQTAVVSYRKKLPWSLLRPGLQVDLVAVVHLADKLYFENLQKELADYDRVLYEMVVDKDSQEPNGNTKTHWMPPKVLPGEIIDRAFIEHLMAFTLALDFQGDCIDYWRENWYHADLDFKTFEMMQLERFEEDLFKREADMAFLNDEEEIEEEIEKALSLPEGLDPWRSKLLWASRSLPMPLVGMFFIESICGFSSLPISKSPEMRALYRLDLAVALKLFLAKQLTSFSVLKVQERELVKKSVIIGERNRVAMEELRAAIDEGCKRIAIFYGSGHMPDMDERLRTEFRLVPTQISWRTAWSINDKRSSNLVSIQIIALLILSLIFAVDLCLWELFFSLVMKIANVVYRYFIAALHFLTQT